MATLARRIFEMLLFVGLFVVSMRFVHTYPLPMTTDQQQRLLELSSKFEVTDSEAFYLSVVVAFNLLLASPCVGCGDRARRMGQCIVLMRVAGESFPINVERVSPGRYFWPLCGHYPSKHGTPVLQRGAARYHTPLIDQQERGVRMTKETADGH